MEISSLSQKGLILLLLAAYIAIMGLAGYKLIKSKISDWNKIYFVVLMTLINVAFAIPFILYHDYFLSKDLRAN